MYTQPGSRAEICKTLRAAKMKGFRTLPGLGREGVILMELKEIVIRVVVRTLFLQLMYFLKQRAGSHSRKLLCAPQAHSARRPSAEHKSPLTGGKSEIPPVGSAQPRPRSGQSRLFPLQGCFSSSVYLLK